MATPRKGQKKLVAGLAVGGSSLPLLAMVPHNGGVSFAISAALGLGTFLFYEEIASLSKADDTFVEDLSQVQQERSAGKGRWFDRIAYGKEKALEMENKRLVGMRKDAGLDDGAFDPLATTWFDFSSLLATGWRPSVKQIFLARLPDNTNVFVKLDDLVHIALAGSTRQGKTSIIRQLLSQLIYIECESILLDPHYTPYDYETGEDWTPFTPHLKSDPMECKEYDRIEKVLRYTATTFLTQRKVLRSSSKPLGKHVFIIIDEYPAIVAERPNVQGYVSKLLREGGKYRIHLVIASQNFQVKTVSPDKGGADRENFSTCLYVGGDRTTAKVLLDKTIPEEDEPKLGKGSIYLRCEVQKAACLAYTAWMDHDAVVELVGPSTYEESEEDTEELTGAGLDLLEDDDPLMNDVGDGLRLVQPDNQAGAKPIAKDAGPRADDIPLEVLIFAWNNGYNSDGKLMKAFRFKNNQAQKARKRIEDALKQDNEAVE